jgi:transcription antitermination factor NusG
MEHHLEHRNTDAFVALDGDFGVDMVTGDGVTVTSIAPGARHPECGSIPDNQGLIRGGNDVRRGPGRRWVKPASVVVSAGGPRWYCIETAPRAEDRVVEALALLGFDAVAPKFLDWVPANPARKMPAREVLRPAFPGYVIAEFDAQQPGWRRIASQRGVVRVMGSAPEQPSPIRPVQVAWLLSQFGADGVQRRSRLGVEAAAPLALGTWVRVIAGPYEAVRGRVVASDGRSVMLNISGWRVRMAQGLVRVEVCA